MGLDAVSATGKANATTGSLGAVLRYGGRRAGGNLNHGLQAREPIVLGLPTLVADVDLRHDDGEAKEAEHVIEPDLAGFASALFGVATNEFGARGEALVDRHGRKA